MDQELPTISTNLDAQEVKGRLLKMSKRGKLPGYDGDCASGLLSVAAHGAPFDSKLIVNHQDGEVSFNFELIPMMPRIFAALLIITIWPGLPLTEGFLDSFTWYSDFVAKTGIKTMYWYLPMTILPAPFMWKSSLQKSKASAHESAIETVEKIDKVLNSTKSV
ncbi:hypothetical protein COB72_00760 [bacterium]|nr:MAG: hypothetical protein COB72_00760 [bacterium]